MSESGRCDAYNSRGALVTGLLQTVIGLTFVCIRVVMYTEHLYMADGAVGLWAGIIFILSGILGVVSSKLNTRKIITSVVILDCVSCVAAAAAFFYLGLFWIASGLQFTGNIRNEDTETNYKLSDDLLVRHLALLPVDGVIALVAAAFCCQVLCGRNAVPSQMAVTVPADHQNQKK